MNPPPIPGPPDNSNPIARNAAKASLVAVVLTIGITVILRNNLISDIIGSIFILGGFMAAILALSLIPAHGTRGVLKLGLLGLVLNSLLLVLFLTHFAKTRQKAIASDTAWQQLTSTRSNIDSNLNKSFDPKNGVTNFDPNILGKLSDSLKNASQNSTGIDASFTRALSAFADRTQTASKNYQSARTKLREAHVLNHFDSSDKTQLAARREIVQQFLDANAALKQVATNSEDQMRADLAADHIPNIEIDRSIEFYHASTAFTGTLTAKVRECDDRVGTAMLDALSTLETQWGHWKVDPTVEMVLFEDADARTTYNNDLAAIKAAVDEQLKLQNQLFNQRKLSQ